MVEVTGIINPQNILNILRKLVQAWANYGLGGIVIPPAELKEIILMVRNCNSCFFFIIFTSVLLIYN